jgi:hypothetical protein
MAPGLSPECATTVVAPPQHWFLREQDTPGVADLLRQVHARLPLQAMSGASVPTPTCYGMSDCPGTPGQNMVTEMGKGRAADISRFVMTQGPEVVIPWSRLHSEASRSGRPLNSQPDVLNVLRHIRDRREETDPPRSAVHPLRRVDGTPEGESESRTNPHADNHVGWQRLLHDALQRVPTENHQRYHALLFMLSLNTPTEDSDRLHQELEELLASGTLP